MSICDKIAKSIVARSQILKKCAIRGNLCYLSIEESVFVHNNEYSYGNLNEDIDGFMFDVSREFLALGVSQLNHNDVRFRVDNNLLVFIYDCTIVASDALMEKIRTSEWILEE